MKKTDFFILILFVTLLAGCEQAQTDNDTTQTAPQKTDFKKIAVSYPTTRMDSTIVDDYHGTKVADPFRWLEDDNSDETKAWVKNQNKVTFDYLAQIPSREKLAKRLEKIWNYERFSPPFKEGDKYYYFKNDGLQNQDVLYSQSALDAEAALVLDPNKFSADGTTSLGGISFSKDGKYLAYQISEGGSDWRTVKVQNMEDGTTMDDRLEWIKFSDLAWFKDGFFYSRYPTPEKGNKLSGKNEFQQVYYHKLGTQQAADQLVFSDRKHPNRGFSCQTTTDETFTTIGAWESTSGNALYFRNEAKGQKEFTPIVETFDNDFVVVDNIGDKLLVLTNYKAPNQRLLLISSQKPQEGFWQELIPESEDALRSVDLIGGKILATYIHNASSLVKVFDMKGKYISDLKLPGIGTVGGFRGKKDDPMAFYAFSSFTRPSTIYTLNMADLKSNKYKAPNIDFDSDSFETKQLWYASADGTKVPMFVTHRKGLKLDGSNPTLLYGYGGFDIPILPRFSIVKAVMMESDAVFAVANIRGGGEFGKAWHKAGTLGQKQNVFNDFQAAAEYLIDQKYTSPDKLAIEGRSNGGLLVGACMTQRPDLYKVAFPGVGVLDMLRYQYFTIGRAWATDYGLSEKSEDFKYLYAYSPLHNVSNKAYPATMVTTADHDDRVVPAHSFKFISELQSKHQGDNPVLIRIETSAGHGAGVPTSKKIQEAADMLSFMFYNCKVDVRL